LDDPTIVAIFDGANTADMETGALAASTADEKCASGDARSRSQERAAAGSRLGEKAGCRTNSAGR
jgi:hypothetical protein